MRWALNLAEMENGNVAPRVAHPAAGEGDNSTLLQGGDRVNWSPNCRADPALRCNSKDTP